MNDTIRFHALAAALLGAGLTLGAAAATAQSVAPSTSQTSGTLHACYVPGSGSVYRTGVPGAPAACRSAAHIPFSWEAGGGGSGGPPTGTAAGDLAGDYPAPTVVALQGRPVSSAAPADGQFLGWNAGQSRWEARTPPVNAGGGSTAHAQLTGLSGDDHLQYLLADGVRHSTNGFAVSGTVGQGAIPASGPGARMVWYPGKAAFRVGTAGVDRWDDANIGDYSIALGDAPLASGNHSLAIGTSARAEAGASAAIGWSTHASGTLATAVGIGARASAEGAQAFGYEAQATGQYATSVGVLSVASGNNSIALGTHTTASGDASTALGYHASTNGRRGALVFGDASSTTAVRAQQDNQFVVRAARIWLGNDNSVTATTGRFIETSTGAYLSSGGTWTNSSDVHRKHHFAPVDGDAVLAALAALPITTWSYRDADDSVRHMGPTAQDFHAAFGLGDSDKAIATVDADGVGLAAIQALDRRSREQSNEIARLSRENSSLRSALADLQRRLDALEAH